MKHPLQQAEYVLTAANDAQLPPPGPPEIAFAGRSNAGKSSAINALAHRTRLAFASKTPGRTQQINFFRLRSGALLADLPGYGYAAVPLKLKRHWQQFLARYLATRQSLVGLVLVVDARHGLADMDHTLLAGYLRERAAGAGARHQDGQADAVSAATGACHHAEGDRGSVSGPCRQCRRGALFGNAGHRTRAGGSRDRGVARRRRRGAGSRDARWARHQRKGPAVKGSDSGPKTPCVGKTRYQGTRSGRKAGDARCVRSL